MTARVDSWGQPCDDSIEVHSDAVAALEELDGADGLSPWETDFLDSVREAVGEGWISDRQAEKVRQIHEERIKQGRRWRPERKRR